MCVYFRVINLITPVSNAELTPIRILGLKIGSLIVGVPGPMLISLLAVLPSIGLGPFPLRVPHTEPQKAPLLPPHGTGATPASAICLALVRASERLHAGLKQRR